MKIYTYYIYVIYQGLLSIYGERDKAFDFTAILGSFLNSFIVFCGIAPLIFPKILNFYTISTFHFLGVLMGGLVLSYLTLLNKNKWMKRFEEFDKLPQRTKKIFNNLAIFFILLMSAIGLITIYKHGQEFRKRQLDKIETHNKEKLSVPCRIKPRT
jgi:hypothetical protein